MTRNPGRADGPPVPPVQPDRPRGGLRGGLARGIDLLNLAVEWCCHLLLAVIVAIIVLQVGLRYLVNRPTSWSEEIALLCLVWFGMLALGLGVGRHWHIAITVLRDRLPPAGRTVLDVFAQVLILGFAGVLVAKGFDLVAVTGHQILPASGLSKSWLYLPGVVGGALIIINAAGNLILWRLTPPPRAAAAAAPEHP